MIYHAYTLSLLEFWQYTYPGGRFEAELVVN